MRIHIISISRNKFIYSKKNKILYAKWLVVLVDGGSKAAGMFLYVDENCYNEGIKPVLNDYLYV